MIRFVIAFAALFALALPAAAQTLPRRVTIGAAATTHPEGGVLVQSVRPGAAAAVGGLAAGDIITRIGAQDINAAPDFAAAVRAAPANRPITFAITRGGEAQALRITPLPAPTESASGLTITYEAIRVGDHLRRVLVSAPQGPRQRRPAMLLIGGIGCYSIDDATSAHDPYRSLAHDISRRGVLVMRVEKSGVGDSQGAACATVDFEAELAGYRAALAALRADRRVDPTQIYVFGHSIGTLGAPLLAQEIGAAGVIAAQGAGRTWIEYELINTRRQLALMGASPADIDAAMIAKADCVTRAFLRREPIADLFAADPDCAQLVSLPASQNYMAQVAALNPAALWSALTAPALVIYGTGDFISDEADHRLIVEIANADSPGQAELALIPGMDHYIVNAGTQAESFARVAAGQALSTYDARLSETIGA